MTFKLKNNAKRVIGKRGLSMQSGWQGFLDQSGAETASRRHLHGWPAVFCPLQFELATVNSPQYVNAASAI